MTCGAPFRSVLLYIVCHVAAVGGSCHAADWRSVMWQMPLCIRAEWTRTKPWPISGQGFSAFVVMGRSADPWHQGMDDAFQIFRVGTKAVGDPRQFVAFGQHRFQCFHLGT